MNRRLIAYPILAIVAFAISYFLAVFDEFGLLISYKFVREGNNLRNAMPEEFHSYVDSDVIDKIPDGESPVSDLPEDVRDELWFTSFMREGYTDSWHNPYRIVSEQRNGTRWLGVYSTGRDGVSESKGNDPDDINSWGQDGFNYYPKVIARDRRIRNLKEASLIFLLVMPGCLLIYEGASRARASKKHATANKPAHPTAGNVLL